MRSIIVSALNDLRGIETVEATNGYEALKALPQHMFDMLILDINMPEINGLEVIGFAKHHEVYRKIPIIIISTDHSEAEVQKGLTLGANRYLIKPFEIRWLQDAVEELLHI